MSTKSEEDRVYVHFGTHGTAALDESGKVLWKARLPYEHMHGTGGSPVIHGDLLIFNGDGTDVQFVAALDKRSEVIILKKQALNLSYLAFNLKKAPTDQRRVREALALTGMPWKSPHARFAAPSPTISRFGSTKRRFLAP